MPQMFPHRILCSLFSPSGLASCLNIVSFPDPAFKLDKGLAHFARNLGLPDLAGKE